MKKEMKSLFVKVLTIIFIVQVCYVGFQNKVEAAQTIADGNYTISNASSTYQYEVLNTDISYFGYVYSLRNRYYNWTITYNESKDAYKITSKWDSSMALGIKADSCTSYPELKMYTNSTSNYVYWTITKYSNNTYTLSPKLYSNKYLNVRIRTLAHGTFYDFSISSEAQKWRIRTTDTYQRNLSWYVQTKKDKDGVIINDSAFTGDGAKWSRPYLLGMYKLDMKYGEEISNKSMVIDGLKNSEVTIIEGHGETNSKGYIRVGVTAGVYTDKHYLFYTDLNNLTSNSLSRARCIIFNHCNGANPLSNFAQLVYNKGAQCSIGFINPIEGPNADTWISSFFYATYCSYTIEESMEYADLQTMNTYGHNTLGAYNRKSYGDVKQMLKY